MRRSRSHSVTASTTSSRIVGSPKPQKTTSSAGPSMKATSIACVTSSSSGSWSRRRSSPYTPSVHSRMQNSQELEQRLVRLR